MLPKTQVSFKHQDDGDVMSARIDFQSPSHFSCEWQKTSASSSGIFDGQVAPNDCSAATEPHCDCQDIQQSA